MAGKRLTVEQILPTNSILQGNSLEVLKTLPDGSIHAVVTSPPYYALRDYQTGRWEGGSAECDHVEKKIGIRICDKCGAKRTDSQIGLEPSPDAYIAKLIEVFAEVRRVLRDDGTFWLNIADSYVSHDTNEWNSQSDETWVSDSRKNAVSAMAQVKKSGIGISSGEMMGIPMRLALALQADGWRLKSTVIWGKGVSFCESYSGCTMPESVKGWMWVRHRRKANGTASGGWRDSAVEKTGIGNGRFGGSTGLKDKQARFVDCPGCRECFPHKGFVLRKGQWRPTKGFEFVFMFSKSNQYYGDGEAVKEDAVYDGRQDTRFKGSVKYADGVSPTKAIQTAHLRGQERWLNRDEDGERYRNLRNVWLINPDPSELPHFATFPQALVFPMIKASTSDKGVCPKCGAPWVRVVGNARQVTSGGSYGSRTAEHVGLSPTSGIRSKTWAVVETLDWWPSCSCDAGDPVPAVVLDPFCGIGTMNLAALKLGRSAIGIDLNSEYVKLAKQRIRDSMGLFMKKD